MRRHLHGSLLPYTILRHSSLVTITRSDLTVTRYCDCDCSVLPSPPAPTHAPTLPRCASLTAFAHHTGRRQMPRKTHTRIRTNRHPTIIANVLNEVHYDIINMMVICNLTPHYTICQFMEKGFWQRFCEWICSLILRSCFLKLDHSFFD